MQHRRPWCTRSGLPTAVLPVEVLAVFGQPVVATEVVVGRVERVGARHHLSAVRRASAIRIGVVGIGAVVVDFLAVREAVTVGSWRGSVSVSSTSSPSDTIAVGVVVERIRAGFVDLGTVEQAITVAVVIGSVPYSISSS